jgi:hypothetical protein
MEDLGTDQRIIVKLMLRKCGVKDIHIDWDTSDITVLCPANTDFLKQ